MKTRSQLKEAHGFGGREVFPVIHMMHREQVLFQADLVFGIGAKGVFVIGSGRTGPSQEMSAAVAVKKAFPDKFVGVNLLALRADEAVSTVLHSTLDGLWTDDAGIRDDHVIKNAIETMMLLGLDDKLVYFGGTAFKYGVLIGDPEKAARNAALHMDVVTTSGDGTGSPPDVRKIEAMRKGAGDNALAIASGITPENVGNYDADFFLVATGIQRDFYGVDPDKLAAILEAVQT